MRRWNILQPPSVMLKRRAGDLRANNKESTEKICSNKPLAPTTRMGPGRARMASSSCISASDSCSDMR